jgi:hypothetical protein
MKRKKKEISRDDFIEVARAEKTSRLLSHGKLVYSLTKSSKVYQSILYGRGQYHWHFVDGGDPEVFSPAIFKTYYENLDFEVKIWTNPRRVNYDQKAKGPIKPEMTHEDLVIMQRVIELKLQGLSNKAIDEAMGFERPRAWKILKEANESC